MDAEAIQRILDSVDREEMLRLAEDIIRIPSFKTEESDVARYLAEYLAQRSYEAQLQEVESDRFQTVAILRGSGGGKSLMLNGHIDIDPLAMFRSTACMMSDARCRSVFRKRTGLALRLGVKCKKGGLPCLYS